MKSKRPAISLHMLFTLLERKSFTAEQIMDDLGISRSSFFRALSDFRCYLQEYHPGYEIIASGDACEYRLCKYNGDAFEL